MYRKQKTHFHRSSAIFSLCITVAAISAQSQQQAVLLQADSVTAAASYQYSAPSLFRKLFLGNNYREAWKTPVKLPVFRLTDFGFHIKELGGGMQTKSLRLVDKDSMEWALRSVDKDVRPALPKLLRNPIAVSAVQDLVSAAHPYAPLTVPPLASAVGVTVASPAFYYVPEDPALGEFNKYFAGTVCLLEKRDLLPGVESKGTEKMIQNLLEDHHSALDQKAFLNARLLDMLLADWDRHYDQWKWAAHDSGGDVVYLPLPKDRDQAYFHSNGWLLKFIRLFGMKFSVGFTKEADNLKSLNSVAQSLDELLLNGLSRNDWNEVASSFQQRLTDDIIRDAVRRLPSQQYALNGDEITQKLLTRKSSISKGALDYYRSLAKDVTVYGTDKAEEFSLTGNEDSVTVTIHSAKDEDKVYYRRVFYSAETKKIRLIGLEGDDVFTSEKSLRTKIRFAIDGGPGTNQYNISEGVKAKTEDSDMNAERYFQKLKKPLRILKREGR